jgi:hypothetical protein
VNVYDRGDVTRISVAFTNAAGAAADPTVVRVLYKSLESAVTTLVYPTDAALVKDSTGNYHVDIDLLAEGVWSIRIEGTGVVAAAAELQVNVRDSAFY